MVSKCEVLFLGNFLLEHLYGLILKLFDPSTLDTDQMIVVITTVEFENGVSTLEVVPNYQTCGLELSQYTVNGRQANFFALRYEIAKDFLSAQVAVMRLSSFQDLKDLDAGKGNLQSRIADVFAFQGGYSGRCFKLSLKV